MIDASANLTEIDKHPSVIEPKPADPQQELADWLKARGYALTIVGIDPDGGVSSPKWLLKEPNIYTLGVRVVKTDA